MDSDYKRHILFDICSKNKRIFFILFLASLLLSFGYQSVYGDETNFEIYRRTAQQEIIQKKDRSEELCSSKNPTWSRRSLRSSPGLQTAPCSSSPLGFLKSNFISSDLKIGRGLLRNKSNSSHCKTIG